MRGGLLCVVVLAVFTSAAVAQIPVLNAADNPSFESPDVAFVGLSAPPWETSGPRQLVDVPGIGVIPINSGCGIFENPTTVPGGRITNADGSQLAYIFANSSNDVITGDPMDHAFTLVLDDTYQAGEEYTLTIGFAHALSPPPADSVLTMSLFAHDPSNPTLPQITASETLSVADVNGLTLTDFIAETEPVIGSVIGKQIGIRISTHTTPQPSSATGTFDFDNVRLTMTPEPSSAAICGIALMAVIARRRA